MIYWKDPLYKVYHNLFFQLLKQSPNKKFIHFCGLKRSGNHAIINWIVKQSPAIVGFYNDVVPGKSPLDRQMESHYKNIFKKKLRSDKYVVRNTVLCSFEDQHLEDIFSIENRTNLSNYFKESGDIYEILIIRDPFNFFSSRLHHRENLKIYNEQSTILFNVMSLWKEYAREYLGETHFLGSNKIVVNYNRWIEDKIYRKALAEKLELVFTDSGFKELAAYGTGSSFSGTSLKKAEKIDFATRWKNALRYPIYQRIFKDNEIWRLSEQIFGKIEETELLKI